MSFNNYNIFFPDDFTVYDIETTGFNNKIDKIIEIAAIKVRNNEIVDTYETFINPDIDIPQKIINLTGITPLDVISAPFIEEELQNFIDFVGNDIVVGHNIKSFDNHFIDNNLVGITGKHFDNNSVDTLNISKKVLPMLDKHNIETLMKHYNISKLQHRALSDCEITFEIFKKLRIDAQNNNVDFVNAKQKSYSSSKKLKLSELTTEISNFDVSHPLYNKICVFTGELDNLTRENAAQIILDLGGKVADQITKKTDFLIIGNVSRLTAKNKLRKVEEYNLNGCNIELINENEFNEMLEYTSETDNEDKSIAYSYEECLKIVLNKIKSGVDEKYSNFMTFELKEVKTKSATYHTIDVFAEATPWRLDSFNKVLLKILNNDSVVVTFNRKMSECLNKHNISYVVKGNNEENIEVSFNNFNKLDNKVINDIFQRFIDYSFNAASFGCCHKYAECEKLKKCIHDDQLYSNVCQFKKLITKTNISKLTDEEIKELKRTLKLPVTKDIAYYKQESYQNFIKFNVVDFEIIKELPSAKILSIKLDNGDSVKISSDYLAEMQKSNFVQKMQEVNNE